MALAPLVGMIGAPLLEGVVGGSVLGLSTGALGAGLAGLTGLAQGHGLVGSALDAAGGYGMAGGVGDLAKFGNQQLASGAAGDIFGGASNVVNSAGTFSPSLYDKLGAGIEGLTKDGGAAAFKSATGSSVLSSLGVPAAGAAIAGAMPPMQYGAPPDPYAGSFSGNFTPISDLRKQAQLGFAEGGIADLNQTDNYAIGGAFDARTHLPSYDEPLETYARGGYLDGPGDGMSDSIPATIAGKQPARLADGEFVVPADVVSHLGNGSTKAGAQRLYSMMDKVRKARTGTTKQGRQINANKYMPA